MTALTWDEIVDHFARGCGMLDVIADGTEATVIPRLHEPGFYVCNRSLDPEAFWSWRSKASLAVFRRMVDDGRVFADSAPGVVS